MRSSAQSNSHCVLLDKNETLATVCKVLKSNKDHIFTRSPLRRMVSRSTYTVVPESRSPTATHSAYAGALFRKRRMISRSRFIENVAVTDRRYSCMNCGSVLPIEGAVK